MNINNLYQSQAQSLNMRLVNNERVVPAMWITLGPNVTVDESDPKDLLLKLEAYPEFITDPGEVLNPSHTNLKMYPVTNHLDQIQQKRATLVDLIFYNLSVHPTHISSPSTTELRSIIKGSLSPSSDDSMWAYNQNVVRHSPLPLHQPNFFRPKFVVNGYDYFGGLDQTDTNTVDIGTLNRGKFGLGLSLPLRHEPEKVYEKVTSIDVYAQCLQIIKYGESSYGYQKYPLVCEAMFVVEG